MRGMTRIAIPAAAVLLLAAGTAGAADWAGEWVTDFGRLVLVAEDGRITGEYGKAGTLSGREEKGKLVFTAKNGRAELAGEFEPAADGLSFTGVVRGPGGEERWRGWRADPEAAEGKPADFSGLWLSSLGNLLVEQKGDRVTARWGSQGWAKIEGTVKGRRLEFTWTRIRWSGKAWIELTPGGDRFFGLTDEDPPTKWLGVRAPGFEPDVKPVAEKIVKGVGDNLMLYHLRAPKGWRRGKPVDAIVLLHGSNWSTAGMTAVTARAWPELGRESMIVGIQGENWADWSDPDDLRFNYTYVNWMGRSTYKGYPYTDRESPFLVHQLVTELREKHDFGRVFVVGHSQGGFLAYALHMHYPESFAGVAALAGGLLMQAEPDVFEDEELMRAQRAIPLAMVHGRRDAQWGEKTGRYNHERFLASGFPYLRLFRPDAGHAYDFLPVGEAVAWLDALSTDDAKKLKAFAEKAAGAGEWRDVAAALRRAEALKATASFKALAERLDDAAGKELSMHLAAIRKNEDGSWVEPFLAWRDQFEFAPAAAEVMAEYGKLRAAHEPEAQRLLGEARQAFQHGDRAAGRAKYQEILDRFYACSRYRLIRGWLEE